MLNYDPQKSFFYFTTQRPVTILMIVIGICVFGWISYSQLPMNLMPDISYPSLTIRTEYPATAPEDVENSISRPLEQALGVVGNLVSIVSISKAGQSDVKLEFTWGADMNQAASEVREKSDQVILPEDAKRPLLLRYDPSLDPILRIGLYGDVSLFYLRYLAEEKIKLMLETLEGVAAVKVKGGLEEEIRVDIQEYKLSQIGIHIQDVKNRLNQENINLAGGNLKEADTEYLVRTLNEFKTIEEIENIVIAHKNGKEIKLKEIAHVHKTAKDREIITRIHGKESVEIEIYKEADVNIIAVAQRVKNRLLGTPEQRNFVEALKKSKESDEKANSNESKSNESKSNESKSNESKKANSLYIQQQTNFVAYTLPQGIQIEILSDPSIFIESALKEVQSTAILGGVLAVLLLFLFLRSFSATIIIGVSIPLSIVATFAAMKVFGVSLNIMSLGGLALGIGMLVDNSIVVLESIARCKEEGDDFLTSVVRGVSEVGSAVVSSTLTTVAVFFPIVFVEGVAGQIFGSMAMTVVFSLLTSLAISLFLIPMLSSRHLPGSESKATPDEKKHSTILSFSTQDALLFKKNQRLLARILSFLWSIPYTFILMLFKSLQTILSLLLFLIKTVFLFLCLTALPVFCLLKIFKISFSYISWLSSHAVSAVFLRFQFPEKIQADFLTIQPVAIFLQSLQNKKDSFQKANWMQKILHILFYPLFLALVLVRFILESSFDIVFHLLHALFILILIFGKGIFLIIRALFGIPLFLIFLIFEAFYKVFDYIIDRCLVFSLNNWALLLFCTAILLGYCVLEVTPRLGKELIPELHQGEFHLEIAFPVGTTVEKNDQNLRKIETFLLKQDRIAKIATVAGSDKLASTKEEQGEHTARITVTMKPEKNRNREEENLIQTIRSEIQGYPGMEWKISRPVLFTFKTPVEIEIHGYNLQKLQEIAHQAQEQISLIPGVYDVKSNTGRGNPEIQIIYNRKLMSHYKLNLMEVATLIRSKVKGDVATRFKEKDRRVDILVRLSPENRDSIEHLKQIVVNPGGAKPIHLSSIADIVLNEGPSEIRRINQNRTAIITANISGKDLQTANNDIYQALQNIKMPPDFSFTLSGQNKEMQTSLKSLELALFLALFLVYVVMASQFESLLQPMIIMFTVPLAFIGVVLTLDFFKIPLSIMVFLGMIVLAGIVVNNAIVLIDYINQLKARGMNQREAIQKASQARLRPILMTTLTTVLGLLPMVIASGDGSEMRIPMAITVISGLISSSLLTLVVVPTIYNLLQKEKN